jgi:outer membrane usher protein
MNSPSKQLLLVYLILFPFFIWADDENKNKEADLQAFYAKAFGKKRAMPSQLAVNLQIGRREVVKLKIYSNDRKEITHIETAPFLVVIKTVLKSKYLAPFLERIDKSKSRLSLSELKKSHIKTEFDQANLSLKLLVPIKMRIPTEITIGRKRKEKQYPAESELAQPAMMSAYTNLDAMFDYDANSKDSKQRLSAESVVNIKGVVLENRNTWRNDRKQALSRESTRVVIDDPATLHRYTLGDVSTEYRNYQQGMRIAGLKIEKKSELNPYLKTKPASEQRFSLERDSEVKIYINGFLKDKKKLDAGEYSLTDLRLEAGVNKVRLEIIDKKGKQTQQFFSLLKDQSLLTSGASSYALQVGIPAYRLEQDYHYDTSTILVSGHYKTGITERLTADASFITDGKSIQMGVNALIPTEIGRLSGRVSQLRTDANKQGFAVGGDYQYTAPAQKKNPVQFSVAGDFFDKEFSALNYDLEKKKLYSTDNTGVESRLHVSVGKKVANKVHASFNIQRETTYAKNEAMYSVSLGLSQSFKKGGSISAQVRYQNNQQKDKSVNLRLNLPLVQKNKSDRQTSLTTSYNSLDQRLINTFFIRPKGNTGLESVGASLSSYSGKGNHTLSANVSYRGDIAEVGFSQSLTKVEQGGQQYQARSSAKLRTAISFADGQFAISKPIRDSFAIVAGPKNQKKDIAVARGNNTFTRSEGNELPDHYQSVIQKNRSPAVINVSSYHYNTINVDSAALPLGSDLDSTEFEVKAGYKQGYLLKAGGEQGVIVDATLVDEKDQPLVLKGGQLVRIEKKSKPIAFFTNRTGRIRLISVPPGQYRLELFDSKNKNEQVLNIPNKIGKIHVVGKVQITL